MSGILSDRPPPVDHTRPRWLTMRETLKLAQAVIVFLFVCILSLLVIAHMGFDGDGSCISAQLLEQHGIQNQVVDAAAFYANSSLFPARPFLSDYVVLLWAFPPVAAPREVQLLGAASSGAPADLASLVKERGSSAVEASLSVLSLPDSEPRAGKPKHDYEFSPDPAFLLLSADLRPAHGVRTLNLTLPVSCLGSWPFRLVHHFVGNDDIIVNQFMHGLMSDGVLRNVATHEVWTWNLSNPFSWLKYQRWRFSRIMLNLSALWRAVVALLLISCMTGLIVRVLISSGVVIMFPLFAMLRFFGHPAADIRVLGMAYPWLGSEVEILTETRQPTHPLIRAHIISVVIMYSAYEACQFAWRRWVYGFKPLPTGIEVRVFALVMIIEYFLLVYARDATTIRYLPRFLAFALVIFHLYVFAVPYPFEWLANSLLWLFCIFWMIFFLVECEAKALRRGTVSIETPRAFFTLLASPQWLTALPPIWSLFHELNRVVPVVPAPPETPPLAPMVGGTTGGGGTTVNAVDVEEGLVRRGVARRMTTDET